MISREEFGEQNQNPCNKRALIRLLRCCDALTGAVPDSWDKHLDLMYCVLHPYVRRRLFKTTADHVDDLRSAFADLVNTTQREFIRILNTARAADNQIAIMARVLPRKEVAVSCDDIDAAIAAVLSGEPTKKGIKLMDDLCDLRCLAQELASSSGRL